MSNATSTQAVRGASSVGSTVVVQIRLANSTTELHRSEEVSLKEVRKRLHLCDSSPDGPAPSWVLYHTPLYCSVLYCTVLQRNNGLELKASPHLKEVGLLDVT